MHPAGIIALPAIIQRPFAPPVPENGSLLSSGLIRTLKQASNRPEDTGDPYDLLSCDQAQAACRKEVERYDKLRLQYAIPDFLAMVRAVPATIAQTFHVVRESWRDPAYGFWGAGVGGGEPLQPPEAHCDAAAFVFAPEPTVAGAAIQLWLQVEAAPRALAMHHLQQALSQHFATQELCATHRLRQEREIHRWEAPQRQENRDVKFLRRRAAQADMRQAMIAQRMPPAMPDAGDRPQAHDEDAGLIGDLYRMATRQPAASYPARKTAGGSWPLPGAASFMARLMLWRIEWRSEKIRIKLGRNDDKIGLVEAARPMLTDILQQNNRSVPLQEGASEDTSEYATAGPDDTVPTVDAAPLLQSVESDALEQVKNMTRQAAALYKRAYPTNMNIQERAEEILNEALADAHGIDAGAPPTGADRVRVLVTKFDSETTGPSLKRNVTLSLFDIAIGKLQRDYGINYWFDVAVADAYKALFRLRYRHYSGSFPITDLIESKIGNELSEYESNAESRKAREKVIVGQIRMRLLSCLALFEKRNVFPEIKSITIAALRNFLTGRSAACEFQFHRKTVDDAFAIRIGDAGRMLLFRTSRKSAFYLPRNRVFNVSDNFSNWLQPALPLTMVMEYGQQGPVAMPFLGGIGMGMTRPKNSYRFHCPGTPALSAQPSDEYIQSLARRLDDRQIAKAKADLDTLFHTSSDVWKVFSARFVGDLIDYFSFILSIVSLGSPAMASKATMILTTLMADGSGVASKILLATLEDDRNIKNQQYEDALIGTLLSAFSALSELNQVRANFLKMKKSINYAKKDAAKSRKALAERLKAEQDAARATNAAAVRRFEAESMPGVDMAALTAIDIRLRQQPSYANWIVAPLEQCMGAAGDAIDILHDLGYVTEVRGIWRFKAADDFMPGNHFVAIGIKDGKAVLVDATAGQFSWAHSDQSVIIGSEAHWKNTFVNLEANQDMLIKYRDYPNMAKAQSVFGQDQDVDMFSGDYRVLHQPGWAKEVSPEMVAELKQQYIDLEKQRKMQRYAMVILDRLKKSLPTESMPDIRGLSEIGRADMDLLFSVDYDKNASTLGIRKIADIAAALNLSAIEKLGRRYKPLIDRIAAAEQSSASMSDGIAAALTDIAEELTRLLGSATSAARGKELIKVLIEIEMKQTKMRNAVEAYARSLTANVVQRLIG